MNLIDRINKLINTEVITKLSSITGDNPKNIEKGFQGTIPTILMTLVNKDNTELTTILEVAKNNFTGLTTNQNHSNILKTIFGDKLEHILFTIADYAGIKQTTMHLIANTSVACIFDSIKKTIPTFDFQGVKNLFSENENVFSSLMPEKLEAINVKNKATFETIKPIQPINTVKPVEEKMVETLIDRPTENIKKNTSVTTETSKQSKNKIENSKKSKPLKWIVLLLILLAIVFFVWKSCNKTNLNSLINEVDTTKVIIEQIDAIKLKDSL